MGGGASRPTYSVVDSGICTQFPAWRLSLPNGRSNSNSLWDYQVYTGVNATFLALFILLTLYRAVKLLHQSHRALKEAALKLNPNGLFTFIRRQKQSTLIATLGFVFASLFFIIVYICIMLGWFASESCQPDHRVYDGDFAGLLSTHSAAIFFVGFAEVSFLAAVLMATMLLRVSSSVSVRGSSTKMLTISFVLLWLSTLVLMFTSAGYLADVYSYVDVVDEDIPDNALAPVAIYVAYCTVYLLTVVIALGVSITTLSKRGYSART